MLKKEPHSSFPRSAIISLLLIIIAVLFKPAFQSNDDKFFIYAFSGTYYFNGHPFANCIHITKLIGYCFVWLYEHFGNWHIEFYTWYLYFILFVCANALNNIFGDQIMSLERLKPKWLYIIVFNILFVLPFMIMLQFTMISILAVVASYLVLKIPGKWNLLMGCLLIVLASSLRYKLVPFALVIMIVTDLIIHFKSIRKPQFGYIKRIVLAFILCFVVIGANSLSFSKEEKQFYGFAKFMSSVADNGVDPSSIETADHKPAFVGWDQTERALLENFFASDSNLYHQTLDYESLHVDSKNFKINLKSNFKLLLGSCMAKAKSFTWLRVVLFLFILTILLNPRLLFYLCLSGITYLSIQFAIIVFLRMPPFHLDFALFISIFLIFLYVLLQKKPDAQDSPTWANNLKKINVSLPVVVLLITLYSVVLLFKHIKENSPYSTDLVYQSNRFSDSLVYIREPWYNGTKNVFEISKGSPNNILTWSVWFYAPAERGKLMNGEFNNLTTDVIKNRERVRFILSDVYVGDFVKMYGRLIRKYYNTNIELTKTRVLGNGYCEYKINVD